MISAATFDASACEVAVLIKASLSAAMLDALACKASSSTATFYAPMYKMAVLIKGDELRERTPHIGIFGDFRGMPTANAEG